MTADHTIDATGKSLGRVASTAAALLMGKNTETFARNSVTEVTVHVTNTSKANITEKKKREKAYVSYSGYPGGLRTESLEQMIAKKGSTEAFRRAIKGMLPKNKLTRIMMKNLIISE